MASPQNVASTAARLTWRDLTALIQRKSVPAMKVLDHPAKQPLPKCAPILKPRCMPQQESTFLNHLAGTFKSRPMSSGNDEDDRDHADDTATVTVAAMSRDAVP